MVRLIISVGIIIENELQMYSKIGGGNVDMWHDRMYVTLYLVAT